jgi:hypothetical protein
VVRQEEGVSDQRWDHGAADDHRNQEGILHLVDDSVTQTLVRTQKFSEKGKAPPPLIENRESGLFFMDGQLRTYL